MKRKIICIVMVLCVLTMAAFTGCGDKNEKPFDYDLSEYVALGNYIGIEVEPYDIEVTDEEVQAEIQARLELAATEKEVREGVVVDGDKINISFVGTVDGEAIEGGSTDEKGIEVIIGQSQMIDGFIEGLMGVAVGDTVVLDLQFPDPYQMNTDLSGKPCQFTVTINYKLVPELPEYNLEFVKANSECASIEEYETSIYEELLGYETADAEYARQESVWMTLIEDTEIIKYDEKELKERRELIEENYKLNVQYAGYDSVKEFLKENELTEEDYEAYIDEYAKSDLKNDMVTFAIAQKEGLEVTDEEYAEMLQKLIEDNGFETDEEVKETYGSSIEDIYGGKDYLLTYFMFEEVLEVILTNVVEK